MSHGAAGAAAAGTRRQTANGNGNGNGNGGAGDKPHWRTSYRLGTRRATDAALGPWGLEEAAQEAVALLLRDHVRRPAGRLGHLPRERMAGGPEGTRDSPKPTMRTPASFRLGGGVSAAPAAKAAVAGGRPSASGAPCPRALTGRAGRLPACTRRQPGSRKACAAVRGSQVLPSHNSIGLVSLNVHRRAMEPGRLRRPATRARGASPLLGLCHL